MWHRIGFAALCLALVVDAVWIAMLTRETPASAGQGRSASSSSVPINEESGESSRAKPSASPSRVAPPGHEGATSTPRGVPAGAVAVKVLRHTDGDTLHVLPLVTSGALLRGMDTTVRLLEIDTPESVDPSQPVQCYSRAASRELARLLPVGSKAWADEDSEALDPYGRTLLYLWTADGRFVNLEMVRRGAARAVLFEPNDRYIARMRSAQDTAQSAQRGLWGACSSSKVRGLTSGVKHPSGWGADPRFDYCYEANDAGYGNYVRGRDEEYDWYDDADNDGIVCEF